MGGLEGGDGCRVTRGEQNEAVIIIPTPVRGGEGELNSLFLSLLLPIFKARGGNLKEIYSSRLRGIEIAR